MDNEIILITVRNKYGWFVNISNYKIEPLYRYFKKRVKSPAFPISDNQRFFFEKIIVETLRITISLLRKMPEKACFR